MTSTKLANGLELYMVSLVAASPRRGDPTAEGATTRRGRLVFSRRLVSSGGR